MLELIIKLVIFTVMPVSGFFVIKNLIDSEEKLFSVKNLLIILLLCVANGIIYTSEYKSYTTLFNFLFLIIGYKYIFKISFFQSLLLSICIMIFTSLSEMVFYVLIYSLFNKSIARNYSVEMLIGNIVIGCMINLISNIGSIKKLIKNVYIKLEKFSKLETIFISTFWIIIISILCYLISKNGFANVGFGIIAFIEFTFILFMFNYFRDKNRFINLNEKFDELYEYIQTMEEALDVEQMNIHEYKNQLSMIRSMSTDKKVKEYIDSLVEECLDDGEWNTELKNLPKGGLKGFLHYKLAQATNRKLKVLVTVSKQTSSVIETLSLEEEKQLSRLLGIYIDNAMEAAEKTPKRLVSLEFYKIKQTVYIVITNSMLEEETNVELVGNKGFTTKGKGHGRGTYLAKKMLLHNSKFSSENSTVQDYYIEKILIN